MKILPNGVAVIEGDTHHAVWCESEGLVHDLFTANIIRRVFRDYGVAVAVDAGANIGTLTRVMLDAGAVVHAFECNPAAVECLRHNCPEAVINEVALADKQQMVTFCADDNAGASFVKPTSEKTWLPPIAVQAMPLDAYVIRPGFIKFDIEGYEPHALLGAQRIIQEHRPAMMIEVNQGALQRAGRDREVLAGILRGFGYSWSIIQPDCQWSDPQFDILATPL